MKKSTAPAKGKCRPVPVLLAALFFLAGCTTQAADAAPSAQSAGSAGIAQVPYEAPPLGSDPFAFTVEVAGAVLALPCLAAALWQQGWHMEAVQSESLPAQSYAEVVVVKGGARLLARLANTGEAAQPLAEGSLVGLVAEEDGESPASVVLPGGLAIGAQEAAVRRVCGAPTFAETEEEKTAALRYIQAKDAFLSFGFGADGRVKRLEVMCLQPPAAPPAEEDLPAEARAYRPPEALGEDWREFNILYAGQLYALPAPVAQFLQNGWCLRDTGTVQPGAFTMGVCLAKGGQVLRTVLYNFSDAPQPLTGCFVAMVESSQTSMAVPLALPGGISETSTLDEVRAAYGEPHDAFQNFTARHWTYEAENGRVVFRFRPDTLVLYDVEVWHTALAQ